MRFVTSFDMITVVSIMLKATREWVKQAEYDIDTAEQMLFAGRYLYVVFFCHLAIEKMLKAAVTERTAQPPPRTHNLILLAQLARLSVPREHAEFIGKIGDASIVTRYPQDLSQALTEYTEPMARLYLQHSKEVLRWIKEQLP